MALGTARADKIGLMRIFGLLLTTDSGLWDHSLTVPPLPLESHSPETQLFVSGFPKLRGGGRALLRPLGDSSVTGAAVRNPPSAFASCLNLRGC